MNLLLMSLTMNLRNNRIHYQLTPDGNTMVVNYPVMSGGKTTYWQVQIMSDPYNNGQLVYLVYDITHQKMPYSSKVERQMINFNNKHHPYRLIVDKERYIVLMYEQYISGVSDREIELHCTQDIIDGLCRITTFAKTHYSEIINAISV